MLSLRGTRNFKACSLKYYLLLINIEKISQAVCQALYKSPALISKCMIPAFEDI